MTNIGKIKTTLEKSLSDAVRTQLPQIAEFELEVDILENDRKKRNDASQESWHPASGEIRIRFRSPVKALQKEGADTSSFAPIDIKGEPLSATVLRNRR